jgi:peptide deformylase
MIRPITVWPDTSLHRKCVPITDFGKPLADLIRDLVDTMVAARGLGLAAPQIGVSKQVAIVDFSEKQDGSQLAPIVNPVIVSRTGESEHEEGCLSFPSEDPAKPMTGKVRRAASITFQCVAPDGTVMQMVAEGIRAVALQHEIDHLYGHVFVEYLSSLKRELIQKRLVKLKRRITSYPTGAIPYGSAAEKEYLAKQAALLAKPELPENVVIKTDADPDPLIVTP